jgi:DNA-binding XRE family transcriptional regulator
VFYGCNLRKMRIDSGLTLKRLNELSGVHVQTLMRLEKGDCNPRVNTLAKIAKQFEMTVDELFLRNSVDEIAR